MDDVAGGVQQPATKGKIQGSSHQCHLTLFDKHVTQAKGISWYEQYQLGSGASRVMTRVTRSLLFGHWPNRKELHTSVPRPVRQKLSAPCTGTRSTHDDLQGYKSVHTACEVSKPAQLPSRQSARYLA